MNVSRIFSSVGQFFGKSSGKAAEVIPEIAKPVRMTKTLRDPTHGELLVLKELLHVMVKKQQQELIILEMVQED